MPFSGYFILFIFVFFISYNTFAENIERFEGLIVNDTRLDQNNIKDLPLNISIITAEEIKLSPAKTLQSYFHRNQAFRKIVNLVIMPLEAILTFEGLVQEALKIR